LGTLIDEKFKYFGNIMGEYWEYVGNEMGMRRFLSTVKGWE
tara:strand:- start:12733 stop:12855 length:123 start_codon:yes stop_codon:yes gene_type:complete